MALFDDNAESIGVRFRNYSEPTFEYYNRSARKSIRKIASQMESWFAAYPDEGKKELRSALRSKIESQHQGAFFELFLHELLTRSGYGIQLHPDVGNANRPDFLASWKADERFLLEATTTNDSEEEVAAQKRIDQLYDTLNRLASPDFFISVVEDGAPASAVPGAKLRGVLPSFRTPATAWTTLSQFDTKSLRKVQISA